jgi:hypothetical protein
VRVLTRPAAKSLLFSNKSAVVNHNRVNRGESPLDQKIMAKGTGYIFRSYMYPGPFCYHLNNYFMPATDTITLDNMEAYLTALESIQVIQ